MYCINPPPKKKSQFHFFAMSVGIIDLKHTWQAEDGEVWSTLCEAGALPNTGPPQARVRVHGCHNVVKEVLCGPLVHPRRGDYSRYSYQTQNEA